MQGSSLLTQRAHLGFSLVQPILASAQALQLLLRVGVRLVVEFTWMVDGDVDVSVAVDIMSAVVPRRCQG